MLISLIIKAIDKATAPVRRITGATRDLAGKGFRAVSREGGPADRALNRITATSQRLPGRLRAVSVAAAHLAGRAGMGALRLGALGAAKAIGKTIGLAVRLASIGVGALAAGAGFFAGGVLGMSSSFEQFQVILENTEGSAAKARKAMGWVRQFATKTPYEVSQVMEAFVRLRAYGIDPTTGALTSLGNASSGMNKQIMDAVEMLADAQTGEFERLKEFGIRAKVVGDNVSFSYMHASKEVSKTARNSAGEIQRAILGIFDQKFSGMMDRQSRTFAGMWSNIKDQFAGAQLDVGSAGFFDFIKGKLGELLAWINKLSADGTLERWAKKMSDWLIKITGRAIELIENTDWAKFGSDLGLVASATWRIVTAMAKLVELTSKMPTVSVPQVMAGPQGSMRGASGFGASWGKWFIESLGSDQQKGGDPRATPRNLQPGPARSVPGRTPPRSQPTQVGGRLDVRIQTDPGSKATVTRLTSANRDVPINITRGPVLVG